MAKMKLCYCSSTNPPENNGTWLVTKMHSTPKLLAMNFAAAGASTIIDYENNVSKQTLFFSVAFSDLYRFVNYMPE